MRIMLANVAVAEEGRMVLKDERMAYWDIAF
jgi:hypothetical protein